MSIFDVLHEIPTMEIPLRHFIVTGGKFLRAREIIQRIGGWFTHGVRRPREQFEHISFGQDLKDRPVRRRLDYGEYIGHDSDGS